MPTNMEMERRSRSNVCCAISRGSPVPVNRGYTHKPRLIKKQTVAGSYADVLNSYQQARYSKGSFLECSPPTEEARVRFPSGTVSLGLRDLWMKMTMVKSRQYMYFLNFKILQNVQYLRHLKKLTNSKEKTAISVNTGNWELCKNICGGFLSQQLRLEPNLGRPLIQRRGPDVPSL